MPNETPLKSKSLLSTNRIEALTDGIFAIAMTLMILNLNVPEDITGNISVELVSKLLNLIPNLETYIISFLVLGIFWLRHQIQFNYIKSADRTLIWINIFLLMFVALIPFTTNILMAYPGEQLPFMIYIWNLIILALVLSIHWSYAAGKHRLVGKSVSAEHIKTTTMLNNLGVVIFLISFLTAFISVRAAIFILYLDPLLYFLYHKFRKDLKTSDEG